MSSQRGRSEKRVDAGSTRLVATLSLAGLLSGLIIVTAYDATLPTIKAYKAKVLRKAVFQVLPGVSGIKRLQLRNGGLVEVPSGETEGTESVYAGFDTGGGLVGYAIPGEGAGFQDTIRLLYGYLPQQRRVAGMEILESRETPGLGDKIYKDAEFVGGFGSLAIDPQIVLVKKGTKSAPNELDAITGATISSRAVVRIINQTNRVWVPRLDALEGDADAPGEPLEELRDTR